MGAQPRRPGQALALEADHAAEDGRQQEAQNGFEMG